MHVVRGQPLTTPEKRQLDEEYAAHDLPSKSSDEVTDRTGGAAGGKQIVMNEHPRSARERIGVDLQCVDPVLERIFGADRLVWQLAWLASWGEPRSQLARKCPTKNEAAGLRGYHEVDLQIARKPRQPGHGGIERARVEEQRRDVLEHDPGPWEVRDVTNKRSEVDSGVWLRAHRLRCNPAQVPNQQQVFQVRGHRGQVFKRLDRLLAALRVARAQRRREDALQQLRFAIG